MKSNILIVEDHELTRFGLKTAFEACDFVESIYEAESAEKTGEIGAVRNAHCFGNLFNRIVCRSQKLHRLIQSQSPQISDGRKAVGGLETADKVVGLHVDLCSQLFGGNRISQMVTHILQCRTE